MNPHNDLDALFLNPERRWNQTEPPAGHELRFSKRLRSPKKRRIPGQTIGVAAAMLVLFTLVALGHYRFEHRADERLSAELRQTDSIFTAALQYELSRVKSKNTPENAPLIAQALFELQEMDREYDSIKAQLAAKGESKTLISALVSNLKRQIAFLENVLREIEKREQERTLSTHQVI